MSKTINILSVIDVETILQQIQNGRLKPGTMSNPTYLGAWSASDNYIYMITALGFIDTDSTTRAGSELRVDARIGDTIQWELTCPGSGLQHNAIIANVIVGDQPSPPSLTRPEERLTLRKIYEQANNGGYQLVRQNDFVSDVLNNGITQYFVEFQIINTTGENLGFFKWDPFVNVMSEDAYKEAKTAFLKKKEAVLA
ncbi:hypothetical protein CXF68_07745 [Tenacibaculum sp. Bg11-29]|uniref:AidA/PixA family protein n=1 Tax=Tenacibaculum sp. Bg11-29 TaxID=2058306 RepID=UPI000C31D89B|nr:AidA/PixA family protein [Tenacibaculum sp. Bg11-29]PKH50594.1 hypothetical protein CXF68_07745 [Tenacibaculum sp. Bg11-29]